MPDVDPIISALLGVRQYPTDDPIAGIQPPLQTPKLGATVPPVNAAPQPNQVMSGVGDLTGVNDAVKALRGQMTPEEQQGFAATAAFGLVPGVGEMRPVAKAAEELAPPLYSAAAKAIQDARLTKASPEQWLGYLRNQPGVKQEELGYMGALPSGPQVTKDEMQQWANANQVQLKDVVKQSPPGNPGQGQYDPMQHADRFMDQAMDDVEHNHPGIDVDSEEFQDMAHERALELASTTGNPGNTKFGQYQLPGGQNYREMLMTLPTQAKPLDVTVQKSGNGYTVFTNGQRTGSIGAAPGMTDEMALQIARQSAPQNYVGRAAGYDPSTTFTSSHWDEPNVIAHARMNDRVVPDAQGNPQKTLFLEELQSDWHQKGRKQGYSTPSDMTRDQASDIENRAGYSANSLPLPQVMRDAVASGRITPEEAQTHQNYIQNRIGEGVPDAPFKQTWPDLMLKRLVRHAAENGYDQLAWTPGDVQADRYDLSKHLNNIVYSKNPDGSFYLSGDTVQGTPHTFGGAIPADKLPDYVGKDLADKIANDQGTPRHIDPSGTQVGSLKELSGADLKVGSEGMRAFYDKMLVDKANAIGKKYGARVAQAPLPVSSSGQQIAPGYIGDPQRAQAHVLPLTPELKRAALTKGFPMFAAGGLTAGGLTGGQPQDENQQMLQALRGTSAPGSTPTPQP